MRDLGVNLSDNKIIESIVNFQEIAGLKGRWQKLNDSPLMYCDTGHNEAGVKEIINQLNSLTFSSLNIVWGMAKDKDVTKILSLLPKEANYYFCEANINRALPVKELRIKAKSYDLIGESYASVKLAINAALSTSKGEDLILIGGSNFIVAEIPEL